MKIMVSGGVASPYDPLDSKQFTLDEIGAAVEEAEAFGRYVQAHAYTPEAITRAVSKGVRVAFEVPAAEGPKIVYALAPLAKAKAGTTELVKTLVSAEARAIYGRYGFVVPGGT